MKEPTYEFTRTEVVRMLGYLDLVPDSNARVVHTFLKNRVDGITAANRPDREPHQWFDVLESGTNIKTGRQCRRCRVFEDFTAVPSTAPCPGSAVRH